MKICLPKSKWCTKSKVNIYVLNLSDKVKILDLLTGNMSLVGVGWYYGKNESSICSMALNSMHPEHLQFFLNSGLFGTTYPWIPRICCIAVFLLP
jgi:hypothetical protein